MTKKHFIALADTLRASRPDAIHMEALTQWSADVSRIEDFCATQNPNFDRQRWIAYIREGK